MIAQPIRILDPLRPSQPVAFGDLIDFARYRRSRSTADVCDACNTINPASANFCKGCSGKMPAFYASTGDQSADRPVGQRTAAAVRWFRGLAPVGDWTAALLLMLCAAFGPWLVGAALIGAMPPVASPAPQVPHATALAEAEAAALMTTLSQTDLPARSVAEAGTKAEPAVSTEVANTAVSHATLRESPPPPSAVTPARVAPRAAPARAAPLGPVAACEGLDFLSRAICMNNRCAKRALSSTAQCAPVNRQRRMDEARRNPQLAG